MEPLSHPGSAPGGAGASASCSARARPSPSRRRRRIDYADLPGFPHAGVSGHSPKLVVGDLEGVRVAVFGGRAHYYETGDAAAMRLPLEMLQRARRRRG